jgi:hypothetical protein
VTIKDTTFVGVGKVYRSCGDCTNNGGPRNVVIDNIRVNGVTSDLVGINSNYGWLRVFIRRVSQTLFAWRNAVGFDYDLAPSSESDVRRKWLCAEAVRKGVCSFDETERNVLWECQEVREEGGIVDVDKRKEPGGRKNRQEGGA